MDESFDFNLVKKRLILQINEPYNKFINICSIGELNLAQKIYYYYNGKINIYAYNNKPFRISCSYGKLNVAKWLYNLKKINLNKHNKYLFNQVCENNHFGVAKCLYKLGILEKKSYMYDITYSFEKLCNNGHLDFAKWLYQIGKFNCIIINIV